MDPIDVSLLKRAKAFNTKKALGQNFLISKDFLNKISQAAKPSEGKRILEIGPGMGFLTEILAETGALITAIDLDKAAIEQVKNLKNVQAINADALHFDFDTLQKPYSVVGNLPFNVGSKILLRFIGELTEPNWAVSGIEEMVLMFQLEVAERLVAKPGTKAYNPLSMLVQAKSQAELLFKVSDRCFQPIPKVHAGVVRIKPLAKSPLSDLTEKELINLRKVVRQAFSTRRKTLRNCLKGLFSGDDLISLNISPELRPESLSLSEFICLAKHCKID
jgi:16S rRNA (adenine1518-N6/adenine1519-N6)-dimethyltransferase